MTGTEAEIEAVVNREIALDSYVTAVSDYRGKKIYYGRDSGYYFAFLTLTDIAFCKTVKQVELKIDNWIFSKEISDQSEEIFSGIGDLIKSLDLK